MNWLKSLYRKLIDHATKVLGFIGLGLSSLAAIDPGSIREAAQTYLGSSAYSKIAAALFVLVILRGWYTGWKASQKPLPPPVAPK